MHALRVVIADGGSLPRSDLLRLAEDAGFEILGEARDWEHVQDMVSTRAADMVLVSGDPAFARLASTLPVASLVLAPDIASTKEYADAAASAVLTADVPPEVVAATAVLAVARSTDLACARKEAGDLREALESRKLVERAKGVLMRRLGLDEADAYRKIQRASQDENRKMRDIAVSILSAERLYGDAPPAEQPVPVSGPDPR